MSKSLPARPNLEFLRKEAKDLHGAFQRGDASTMPVIRHLSYLDSISDVELLTTGRASVGLQRVQLALALEYGFRNWVELTTHVESGPVAAPAAAVFPAPDPAAVAGPARAQFIERAGDAPVSRRATDDLIVALCALAAVARRHGLVALTTLADPFLDEEPARSGMLALADGKSPDEVRAELAARREPMVMDYDRRQDLIIGGIVRIGAAYLPEAMRAALTAMPGSQALGDPVPSDGGAVQGDSDLDREIARMPVWKRNASELIPLFSALAARANEGGLIAIDGVGARIDDDLIRTGLQPVVDGTDIEFVQTILAARRATLRRLRERRWDMMAAAVEWSGQGMNPTLIDAWCRAML